MSVRAIASVGVMLCAAVTSSRPTRRDRARLLACAHPRRDARLRERSQLDVRVDATSAQHVDDRRHQDEGRAVRRGTGPGARQVATALAAYGASCKEAPYIGRERAGGVRVPRGA